MILKSSFFVFLLFLEISLAVLVDYKGDADANKNEKDIKKGVCPMKQAGKGDTVVVHYTGRFSDGTVFDSSKGREPLRFTLGNGNLIRGFEEAVSGMCAGEAKTVSIEPEKGYGPFKQELVFKVKREHFPASIKLEVGEMFQMRQPDGGIIGVMVSRVEEDSILLDANHPLAGKDLVFEIEVVEVLS